MHRTSPASSEMAGCTRARTGCTSLRKRRVKEADKAQNGGIVFASKMDGIGG